MSTIYASNFQIDEINPQKVRYIGKVYQNYQLTSLKPIPNNTIHSTTFCFSNYSEYELYVGIITEDRKL